MTFSLEHHVGSGIAGAAADIARVRLAVLRDYPCLYDGTAHEEARRLERYLNAARSVAVIIRHNAKAVGVACAVPLAQASEELRRPWLTRELDVTGVLYLDEAVLLPAYRRRGLGARLFREREAYATRSSFHELTFTTVQRADDDPRRPKHDPPRDALWRNLGYQAAFATTLNWRDVGDAQTTPKHLTFWRKHLPASTPQESP